MAARVLILLLLLCLPALGARAQEPGIVPFEAAVQALQAEDAATRAAAARELAFQGRPEAVAHLLAALARPEPDPWVRKDIYAALGALGEATALPALLACLDSEERAELVAECAAALGALGEATAVPRLVELLQDPLAALVVRLRTLDALAAFRDPAAQAALLAMLGAPDRGLRLHAILALAQQGDAAAIAPLLDHLEATSDAVERAATVLALGRLGAAEAVPRIARLLGAGEPPEVREAAAQALGLIGGGEAVATLIALLTDPDLRLQRLAIQGLAALGDPVAAGPLVARFATGLYGFLAASEATLLAPAAGWTEELQLMTRTLRALIALPPLGGGGLLERAAAGRGLPGGSASALALADAQFNLRLVALEALGYLPDSASAPFLAAFAGGGEQDARLRGAAARALGAAGGLAALPALLALLQDPEREVRWSACQALAALGDPAALPALEAAAAGDGDALVRRAAAEAAAALAARRETAE